MPVNELFLIVVVAAFALLAAGIAYASTVASGNKAE
jgi:hypothetical protein